MTAEEKLKVAVSEIEALKQTATEKMRVPRKGLPIAQLLLAAHEEHRHAHSKALRCSAPRLLQPAGETFDPNRADPEKPLAANMSDLFRVEHCRATDAHEVFRITRLAGCRSPVLITASERTLTAALRDFGPDEIVFMLEGPELLPCEILYHGNCSYVARCGPRRLAGEFHVAAVHLRANYDALDEMRSDWPPMQYDKLVGDDVVINLPSNEPSKDEHKLATAGGMLPCDETCDRRSAHGRWVRSGKQPQPLRRIGTVRRETTVRARFVDAGRYTWTPYSCSLQTADWTLRNVTSCLRAVNASSLYTVGDSHAATLHMQLAQALRWPLEGKLRDMIHHSNGAEVDGVRLVRMYDNKRNAESPGAYGAGDGDVLLVNFGQHTAAARTSLVAFEAKVAKWAASAVAWRNGGNRRHVFWLKGVIGIPRNDGYVRAKADGRSVHRTSAYNALAERVVKAASIPVIDNTALVQAFVLSTDDSAHYSDKAIAKWLPVVVLNQLCAALRPKASSGCRQAAARES